MKGIINRIFKQIYTGYRADILGLFERDPGTRLLDCGCGDGELTAKVAETLDTENIFGIDVSPTNVVEARIRGVKTFLGDLNRPFDFPDGFFDVVIANQVIEHIYDTDNFVREIYRVLKKGGYAVISTPNLASFHNILYLLAGRQPYWVNVSDEVYVHTWHPTQPTSKARIMGKPAHYRAFTFGALKELLEYYGFMVDRVVGSGVYPLPNLLGKFICSLDRAHAAIATMRARK